MKALKCPICQQAASKNVLGTGVAQCLVDLRDVNLPTDIDAGFAKLKCEITHGRRIGWWYKDDVEYAKECFGSVKELKNCPPFQGMMIARHDTELRGGFDSDLDLGDCIVIMDTFPVEKCYCESTWMALGRMLDDETLVEIVSLTCR